EAHLSRRPSAELAADDGSVRAVRLLGARRREPENTLRKDRVALAAALRAPRRYRRPHVRRPFRARLAALPRRHDRRLPRRHYAALPGRLRPRPLQRRAVDEEARLRG